MATASYHSFAVLIFYNVVCSGIADAKIIVFNEFNETVEKFSDTVISYGADLVKFLEGMMVLAYPFNACSPIQNAPSFPVFASFVLIDGNVSDECPGYLKVLNAQGAGFDAAVLFGDILAFESVILPFELVIPAIRVEYDVGFKIMKNYVLKKFTKHNFYWMKLIPDSHRIEVIVYGCAGAVFLVLVIVVVLYVLWYMRRERRWSRRHMLSTKQIDQLETAIFAQGDRYDRCTICMEDYKVKEMLRILPCGHAFHRNCIDQWLHDNSDTCPNCKGKIGTSDLNSINSDGSLISFPQENEEDQNEEGQNEEDQNEEDQNEEGQNEEDRLIPSKQNQASRTSDSDSVRVVRRIFSSLAQVLIETNHQNAVVEEGDGHTNVIAVDDISSENHSQSSSVYGSINSSEYVDALETMSASSAEHL